MRCKDRPKWLCPIAKGRCGAVLSILLGAGILVSHTLLADANWRPPASQLVTAQRHLEQARIILSKAQNDRKGHTARAMRYTVLAIQEIKQAQRTVVMQKAESDNEPVCMRTLNRTGKCDGVGKQHKARR